MNDFLASFLRSVFFDFPLFVVKTVLGRFEKEGRAVFYIWR